MPTESIKFSNTFEKFSERCQKNCKSCWESAIWRTLDSFIALILLLFGLIVLLPTALLWSFFVGMFTSGKGKNPRKKPFRHMLFLFFVIHRNGITNSMACCNCCAVLYVLMGIQKEKP